MLTSVDLYHKKQFPAGEIGKIGTDRQLPHEFETVQPARAKLGPQGCLCIIITAP